jgi:NAD(P)-dependent dehydrogenase (short-subunit alcohol dehydrogenase family)
MCNGRLGGRIAVVTGGARGIGRAAAERLSEEGVRVTFLDRDAAAGHATAAELGRGVEFVPADVTQEDEVRAAFEHIFEQHGRIDILVNNAGRNAYFDAARMSTADWDASMALNLRSAWLCAKFVLPAMQRQHAGVIINISSLHGKLTTTGMFPYAAAKAGLLGLTRSLALDYGPDQIRVNAVLPGWTRTDAVEAWLRQQPDPAEAERRLNETQPLRRIATPREVANLIAFLASDEASAITGAEFAVDCGLGVRYAE